jgi:NAD(P)-dependent dehydrogenase (short-subunit alcohol dehydrogenase family)
VPKHILITGSTQGIGHAAAIAMARQGVAVTVHGRDQARTEAAAEAVRQASGSSMVDALAFDLADLNAVRAAAERYRTAHPQVDALCLNAGVFLAQRQLTPAGHERAWAQRFLGHFLLSQILLPSLEASGDGRIIITAAPPNGFDVRWDDLTVEKGYHAFKSVMNSMGGILMSSFELARREAGKGVTVNLFHPGVIDTQLLKEMPWIMRAISRLVGGKAEKGADTMVYLALDPALKGVSGQFFHQRKSKAFKGPITDPANQLRAYELGMKQVGLA